MAIGALVHRAGQPLFVNAALAMLLDVESAGEALTTPGLLDALVEVPHGSAPLPRHLPRRNGMPVWVEVTAAPIPWVDGTATLVTVMDVTGRKSAEEALQACEWRWQQAEEVAQLGVWEYSVDTRRSYWSTGMYGIFAIPPSAVAPAGLDFFPHVHSEDRPRIRNVFDDSFRRGRDFSIEMRVVRSDGVTRYCRCRWSVERRPNGKPLRMFGVLADITDLKTAAIAARQRERLLDTVLATVPYMLSAKDTDGRIMLANPQLAEQLGIPLADLLNQRVGELSKLSTDFRMKIALEDQEVFATGQPLVLERVQGRLPGDMARWHRVIKLPLRDDGGGVTGVVGLSEDITERVLAERQVSESRQLLQSVLDSIPSSIFVKARDGRYILANAAACKAVGRPLAELIGKRPVEIPGVDPAVAGAMDEVDARVLASGQHSTLDGVPSLLKRYSHRSFRVIKAPLHDADGEVTGVIGIAEDVTERIASQRRLRDSEHLMQTIIDTLPENIALKGRDGRYVLVNEQFARVHGVPKHEAIGKRAEDFFWWPEHTARWLAMDKQLLEIGAPVSDIDHDLTHADGTVSSRVLHKVPFRNDVGDIVGILAVSRDITERKQAERRAQEQTHLLQTVVDTLPQAVFLKDLRGRYLIVNKAYAIAHGMTKDEALATRLEDLPGGGPQKPEWVEADRQVLETGQPVYLDEVPFTGLGGDTRLRTLYKFPFWNPLGELVGILGVSEDITDRKREEQALFQAQKLESLGLLAGGVAHDFNNLLMGISGNTVLASVELPQGHPATKLLKNVQNATEMAAGLTRQMLAIAGKATIQPRPVDVSALAATMGQLLRAVVPRNVAIEHVLAEGLPTIVADPSQIQQVIMNLITNAAEAIVGQGSITIRSGRLTASSEYLAECHFGQNLEEGVFVYVEVSDTGYGMDRETVQRIFEPFYTTKVTGRGLGLAAVLGIVRSHKGAVRVTSAIGEGTTFRILFPVREGPISLLAAGYQR